MRFVPPLIITEHDIDEMVEKLERNFLEMKLKIFCHIDGNEIIRYNIQKYENDEFARWE